MLKEINIGSLSVLNCDYFDLIEFFKNEIKADRKLAVTYANAHTVNLYEESNNFKEHIKSFDVIYADGIGIYLASQLLYGKSGFKKRINASDFLLILFLEIARQNWKVFLWGDTQTTLNKIKNNIKDVFFCGLRNGYDFEENIDQIIYEINKNSPEILIVGLGPGLQEEIISTYKNKLSVNIIIAVGQGIKLLAGSKKRGPKIIRVIGFEWLVRLLTEPKRLWRRYLIGIPKFILKVVMQKLRV